MIGRAVHRARWDSTPFGRNQIPFLLDRSPIHTRSSLPGGTNTVKTQQILTYSTYPI
jgi:hypothetical protein